MKLPAARGFRIVGPKARFALPGPVAEDGDAVAVSLGSPDAGSLRAIARALPDPASLAEGTLVVVLPSVVEGSLASRLLAAIGRGRTIPRAHRCSALLARGYVRIGAALDAPSGQDLAWGYVPTEPC